MARTDKGSDVVARGDDVALKLSSPGPRDALLDPREGDIIPDLETKGLHVGEVAQPAEPVLHRSGDVTFESLPEAPESRFAGALSFAEQKRLNSEAQAKDPAYAGRPFVGDEDPNATGRDTVVETRAASRRAAPAAEAPASSTASDLDADSAKVARSQAAEDKADK